MSQLQEGDDLERFRNLAKPSLQRQLIEPGNAAHTLAVEPFPYRPIESGNGVVPFRQTPKQQPCGIRRIGTLVRFDARVTRK